MSIRLYVGNLPKELDREELEALFAKESVDPTSTKVVTDRKTGRCRGFGFVTVETEAQADQIIEKLNGHVFKDNALKIEKALSKKENNADKTTANNGSSNRRVKGKNKQPNHTHNSSERRATQPDPRWASELEKLKEMLVAQTTNVS